MQIRPATPVFVDHTGRRRRLFVAAGVGSAILLILVAATMLAGFIGVGPGHLPGLPGSGADRGIATPAMVGQAGTAESPTPRPGPGSTSARPGAPASKATGTASTTASTSPTTRRNQPTQTPTAHPSKRK